MTPSFTLDDPDEDTPDGSSIAAWRSQVNAIVELAGPACLPPELPPP